MLNVNLSMTTKVNITGQAGIRTHILTTPELESNALDRSATTIQKGYLKVSCHLNSVVHW